MRIQSFGPLPIPGNWDSGGGGGGAGGNANGNQNQNQGGNGDQGGGQGDQGLIDNILPDPFEDNDSTGGDGISVDPLDALSELFHQDPPGDGEGDGTGDGTTQNDGNQPKPGQTAQQVTQAVQQALERISLPENIIPENFDSSDPRQMRALLTSVAKHSVQSALGTMLIPIQHAMEAQMLEVNNRIQNTISATMDGDRRTRSLQEAIPIYANAEHRPMVDMIYSQAMIRHKKDQTAAIASTKKTLQSMGINWQGRGGSTSQGGGNAVNSMRRGLEALDSFAPLPAPGGGNRVNNRLTR